MKAQLERVEDEGDTDMGQTLVVIYHGAGSQARLLFVEGRATSSSRVSASFGVGVYTGVPGGHRVIQRCASRSRVSPITLLPISDMG